MGHICIAVNRILVDKRLERDFVAAFAEQARSLNLGHGLDEGVDYGPLFDTSTRERAERHVQDAVTRGAQLVAGGHTPAGGDYEHGWFYEPTVLARTSPDMLVMNEETFGPVAAVTSVRSDNEAVALANATP